MISSIIGFLIPLAQLFLMWKIYQTLRPLADAEQTKKELATWMRKFAAVFGEDVKEAKKVVKFEAKADE